MRRAFLAAVGITVLLLPQTSLAATRFPSTITATYSGGNFSGTVSSASAHCLARKIRVLDPNGADFADGESASDGTDDFAAPSITVSGPYTFEALKKRFAHRRRICSVASTTMDIH